VAAGPPNELSQDDLLALGLPTHAASSAMLQQLSEALPRTGALHL
jgi:hypothetical protein